MDSFVNRTFIIIWLIKYLYLFKLSGDFLIDSLMKQVVFDQKNTRASNSYELGQLYIFIIPFHILTSDFKSVNKES